MNEDLINGVLTIRDTKFGKTRYVPVHPSTQHALQRYAKLRDRLCPTPSSSRFFLSDRGTRVTYDTLRWTFVKVSRQIGLRGPRDSHGPRLHGLRHRLAINTRDQLFLAPPQANRYLAVPRGLYSRNQLKSRFSGLYGLCQASGAERTGSRQDKQGFQQTRLAGGVGADEKIQVGREPQANRRQVTKPLY